MRKALTQILHLKGFSSVFSPWTALIWVFRWLFWVYVFSHRSHLKGFFPSWTAAKWVCMCSFREKLESQMSHWKYFFPSWSTAICQTSTEFIAQLKLHIWHFSSFFPSWTMEIWLVTDHFRENVALHILHLCGFSILHLGRFLNPWVSSMCLFKDGLVDKTVSHMSHLYDFFCSGTQFMCFDLLLIDEKPLLQITHLMVFYPHEPRRCDFPKSSLSSILYYRFHTQIVWLYPYLCRYLDSRVVWSCLYYTFLRFLPLQNKVFTIEVFGGYVRHRMLWN